MLKKRIIITLTFLNGVLFRTKKFKPDYRYTKNFIDLWSIDELILIDISEKKFSKNFLELIIFFSRNCFVPISVGGGIATVENADILFKNGADKVVLGSGAINKKDLIEKNYYCLNNGINSWGVTNMGRFISNFRLYSERKNNWKPLSSFSKI